MGHRGQTPLKLGDILDRPGWQYRSVCHLENLDPNIFFPTLGTSQALVRKQYRFARDQYCARCPTQAECLQYAKDNKIKDGMFGGQTPSERAGRSTRRRTQLEGRDSDGQFVSTGSRLSYAEKRRRQRERDRKSKNLP